MSAARPATHLFVAHIQCISKGQFYALDKLLRRISFVGGGAGVSFIGGGAERHAAGWIRSTLRRSMSCARV